MWAPTPGTHLTAEEVEVARTLSRLPEIILEYHRRWQPVSIWGAKRKRSALSDDAPLSRGRGEQPNEVGSVAASSPATPLSFYPSGGEEAADDPRGLPVMPPPPPPPPTCRKPFKNAKRHREWVKEQNQAISSLSAEGVNLKRSLEEAKGRHRMLKARNLWMREMHLKLLWVEIGDREAPPQQQQQQREQQVYGQSNSVGVVLPVGPAALLPLLPAACDQRGGAEPAALPITRLPAAAVVTPDFRQAAAAVPAERSRVVLDLNSSAEAADERLGLELGLGLGWQPSGHSTAEARRRRIKIRRDKGGGAHSSMTYNQDKIHL